MDCRWMNCRCTHNRKVYESTSCICLLKCNTYDMLIGCWWFLSFITTLLLNHLLPHEWLAGHYYTGLEWPRLLKVHNNICNIRRRSRYWEVTWDAPPFYLNLCKIVKIFCWSEPTGIIFMNTRCPPPSSQLWPQSQQIIIKTKKASKFISGFGKQICNASTGVISKTS